MSAKASHTSPPLFDWLDHRAAGVLLHPTSFPGDFGIGTLGSAARAFIDFLEEAQIKYWQVCPLGPTGFGDSPYQCFSAFAGNPYLIDLEELQENGLLTSEDLEPLRALPSDRVDYGALYELKWPILKTAFRNFQSTPRDLPYGDFGRFKESHASWLDSFAWFQALKTKFDGLPWYEWPEEFRTINRLQNGKNIPPKVLQEAEAERFYQFVLFGQWRNLRQYARSHQVRIIGDIPIFVSSDSADVWASPKLFNLNPTTLRPVAVAGVPPDYFSEDGQYWGNPLFDWKEMKKNGYLWWLDRLRANFELYDVVRIDHFRGFEAYWEIPFGAPTAREGKWVKGPGLPFFKKMAQEFPQARIIAEDLGSLTPAVTEMLERTGLPGMTVLQFAFGGDSDNPYLPHNLTPNSVVYPGTHDNDTTRGWYESVEPELQDHVRRYFRISGEDVAWDFIRTAYRSPCRLAIFSLQDLLKLDSSGRFNVPGDPQGNWQWRYESDQLTELRTESASYLAEMAELYGRDSELEPPVPSSSPI